MGRDLPKLGAEPEPKGIKGPSVRPQKIQIALSIYQSILAQAAVRTARLSTRHTPSHRHIQIPLCPYRAARNLPQQHRNHTRGTSLGSTPSELSCTRPFASLAPLVFIQAPLTASLCNVTIMYQGERDEKERLELEEQARLDTLPSTPPHG